MIKFYSEPSFKTQSVENFLPHYLIDALLETYFDIQEKINRGRKQHNQLTEVFFPLPNDQIHKVSIITKNTYHRREIPYRKPIKLKTHDFEAIYELLRNTSSEDIEITRLCLHNLHVPLDVHCDGIDITNKHATRPNDLHCYSANHKPERLDDMFNQGLITLNNENPYNGTVIFNQWFPISTYIFNTKENSSSKTIIKFFKGEKWERFGEYIRHATGKPLSENDWHLLQSSVEDPKQLDRNQFFGLSIDNILYFGEPGTLNVWANKKYHASLPTSVWSGDRINLQFETKKKGK